MPIARLPGHEEVVAKLGKCDFSDFNELRHLTLDTYYEEGRERFEKQLTIILRGKKGMIQVTFGNLSGFRLSDANQIIGFDVEDMRRNGWEEKNYKILDYENGVIEGYAEHANVSVCDNPYFLF
jgi:hypothetical protein